MRRFRTAFYRAEPFDFCKRISYIAMASAHLIADLCYIETGKACFDLV